MDQSETMVFELKAHRESIMQALVPLDMHCTQEARNLGMTLDSDLNASSHFHNTTQTAMCQLRVRSFLSFQVTKFFIHAFICSQLDCCVFISLVLSSVTSGKYFESEIVLTTPSLICGFMVSYLVFLSHL